MTYENILYAIDERVRAISLNRPEKMNALSWARTGGLLATVEAASRGC